MPLPIAHGLLGAGALAALAPREILSEPRRLFVALPAGAFAANAADFLLALLFTRSLSARGAPRPREN